MYDTVLLYCVLSAKLVCRLGLFWNISLNCPTDHLAHEVIPRHPTLKPHSRMLHHFRFILPLLPRDEDGLTPLHYYDSAIQLVRHASREPSEAEFLLGINAANSLKTMCVTHMSSPNDFRF